MSQKAIVWPSDVVVGLYIQYTTPAVFGVGCSVDGWFMLLFIGCLASVIHTHFLSFQTLLVS